MGIFSWVFLIITNVIALSTIEAKKVTLDVRGIVPAVFTPVRNDSRLNLSIIAQYAQYLCDNKVNGVLVAGTTGEGPTLTVRDKKRLISEWVRVAEPLNLGVILQVGGIPLPDAQELAAYAEKIGVNAILTLPELYYKPRTPEELVYYVQLIANAAPNTALLYYHNPDYTEVNVDMAEFVPLATRKLPNFKGIKSENFEASLSVMDKLEDGQAVFVASNRDLAPAALIGITDFIMSEINILPKLVIDIVRNSQRGNVKRARAQYNQMNAVIDIINEEGGLPAQKESMALITGLDMGSIRPPEIPLSEERINILADRLKEASVKIVDSS